MEPEEAIRRKKEQQAAAQKRRRAMIREAHERGEPIPVLKPGRPRVFTSEEALARRSVHNRAYWKTYKTRIKEGLERLADMYLEQVRSSDDNFFVGTS
jgi:PHD/YefM family antitoxin component YafN of YafNO toxin-antitoxin module